MAKRVSNVERIKAATEDTISSASTTIEGFAEDIGKMLGAAQTKADKWLSERHKIIQHLTEVRDTASKLLTDMGHQAQAAVTSATKSAKGKRRGRPAGSKNKIIIVGGKAGKLASTLSTNVMSTIQGTTQTARRTMSPAAKRKISAAQKKRWATLKAGKKK